MGRNDSIKYMILLINLALVIEKFVCLEILDLTSDSFQENCLYFHNELRATHCVLPLYTDDNVVEAARQRSKKLAESVGKNFAHLSAQQLSYGENIIWSKAKYPPSCQAIVNQWYKEVDNYQWNKPGDNSNGVIGHFTQIVWRQTTSIGCAMFQTKDAINHYFTVCYYNPNGNVDRYWQQNVFHPSLCGQSLIMDQKFNKLKNTNKNSQQDVILQVQQQNEKFNKLKNTNKNSEQDVILQVQQQNEDSMLLEAIERSRNDTYRNDTYTYYDNDTMLAAGNSMEKWGPLKCDGKYQCQLKEPMDKFNDDCLAAHNTLRVNHKVPLLRISKKLIEMATRRAISMAGLNKNIFHTLDNPYGENLHQLLASPHAKEVDCEVAVNSFYKEIENYDFKTGKSKNKKPIGHFAQAVWKATKEVGCAEAIYTGEEKSKRSVVCCEYEPFGNIKSLFLKNVFPQG